MLLSAILFVLDWREAISLVRDTSPLSIALAVLLVLFAYLTTGLRLILLQKRVALDIPAPLFWGSYYTGLLMNHVLPSGIGGDVVRIMLMARYGYPAGKLVGSGLVDRFLGLIALLTIAGVALLLVPAGIPIEESLSRMAGAVLVVGSILCLVWLPRLGIHLLKRMGRRTSGSIWSKAEAASGILQRIVDQPRRMTIPVLLSLSSHLFFIFSYASLGYAMLPGITLTGYLFAIPGVMLILVLPISLGGLGLREISTMGLLVWLGADPQAALTLSVLFLAVSWVSVIPGIFAAVHYGLGSSDIKELLDSR